MIEKVNAKNLASAPNLFCYCLVANAGLRIPARMIMNEDNGTSGTKKRQADDLTRIDGRRINGPHRMNLDMEQRIFGIEI
jgi:hypothetical protein